MVDSCIWIDHFWQKNIVELRELMSKKMACICGVILLEFIPFLEGKKEYWWLEFFFKHIKRIDKPLEESDWESLIADQQKLIHHGLNRIGIPDLIIMYIAKIHDAPLFTVDKNLIKAAQILRCPLYKEGK